MLFIPGDKAHSIEFSPGAGHVDLYDRVNLIPFDTLATFFQTNLSNQK